ncbi:MAG TPA: glycoside hydrolase family 2 TIM barrel-domain containing protein [Mucilaginibacter sp.]|jgi:beta-galactosidase
MKKSFLLAFSTIFSAFCYGQHLEYKGVYAPSESLVKQVEQPYRQDICLNGSWQFQPVSLPASFREGVDPTPALPPMQDNWEQTPLRIPSPWNVNSFADNRGLGGDFRTYPSYPKEWENIKMGWLRKKFSVPAKWSGKHIVIHFEAVAGDAEILVNGKPAGKHFGIFLPFDVDVTDLVLPGKENEVAVGIRKPSLFDKRGMYGRRTYQAGSFWGQHIAGIWQDVYLEAMPQVHISDVYIKPKVSADILEAEVTVKNEEGKSAEVTLDAGAFQRIAKNAQSVDEYATPSSELATTASLIIAPVKLKLPAHSEVKVTLTANVKGQLKNWSSESPNLYALVIKTNVNGKTVDNKYTRFGWREITFEGSKVLLNGKPIIMKGDSWHFLGIPQMTRRYAASWFKAMRDANLNAVRLHAEPYPSFYLDVADEMGILVLDETAVWASDGGPKLDDSNFWLDTKSHLSELILRDRNHPSIFGWSVSNEVMPIVTGVFRNPPGMKDTLVKYYGIWADICRKFDPSRPWISADGEDDGQGHFPAYVVHYGGTTAMERGKNSGKPWGVGEAGNAYYGTPEQVAETNGNRAYESFLGRMEGVAADSYKILVAEREKDAIYRSVFNMVWYGLKPLPLGLKDTSNPPTLNDGVYFTSYKEGQPGVQPERLGPYCTTLNPGYDPSLPLYQTWPLFDAIKDAATEPLAGADRWNAKKPEVAPARPLPAVKSLKLIAGQGSTLATELGRTGVPFTTLDKEKVPAILFIDGVHPPSADSKSLVNKVLHKGGTVIVWGDDGNSVVALNSLLPAPLEVTQRRSSSLLPVINDDLISGLGAADMYFSELRPPEIITHGLAGPLVQQSSILLEANHTDWARWNRQAEYAKTASVVRSEREKQESGVALIKKKVDNGTLIVTTLPAAPKLAKQEKMVRQILTNAGVPLEAGNDVGRPLLKDGTIVRALYLGNFPIASLNEGASKGFVEPGAGEQIRANATVDGKSWTPIYNANGLVDISRIKTDGPRNNAVAYLSFWVSSQRSLEDLLVEPNIPVVNMEVEASNAIQVYLNGKIIINNIRTGNIEGGNSKAEALKLRQGWNHILVKLIQVDGRWQFSGRLTCNQPDFLSGLVSALEKP